MFFESSCYSFVGDIHGGGPILGAWSCPKANTCSQLYVQSQMLHMLMQYFPLTCLEETFDLGNIDAYAFRFQSSPGPQHCFSGQLIADQTRLLVSGQSPHSCRACPKAASPSDVFIMRTWCSFQQNYDFATKWQMRVSQITDGIDLYSKRWSGTTPHMLGGSSTEPVGTPKVWPLLEQGWKLNSRAFVSNSINFAASFSYLDSCQATVIVLIWLAQ